MERVKVSIILPSLNVVEYIDECLSSVVGQTLQEIEILCVDAGSRDGTLDILNQYVKQDKRVCILHSPVKSYGYQVNMGIKRARGEYIGIVETDDFIMPNMYFELYYLARKYDLDMIKSDFFRFEKKNGVMKQALNRVTGGKSRYENRVIDIQEHKECFLFIMNTWNGIYKKNFLLEYRIFHNETKGASYQDIGFYFQTFMHARRAYFLNKPFYMNRRDNPNSSVYDVSKVFCVFDEYEFIGNLLEGDEGLFEKFKGIYTLRCFMSFQYNLSRSSPKDASLFLRRFSEEFQSFFKRGMIDFDFVIKYRPKLLDKIELLLVDPRGYYKSLINSNFT